MPNRDWNSQTYWSEVVTTSSGAISYHWNTNRFPYLSQVREVPPIRNNAEPAWIGKGERKSRRENPFTKFYEERRNA